MKTREFNIVSVDNDKRILTKTSKNIIKLKDEINYYLKLPNNLIDLFPGLIDYKEDFSSYSIEYIPYENLSNLILGGKIGEIEAENVISKLLDILDAFHQIKSDEPNLTKIGKNFLVKKTIDRIELLENNQLFHELMNETLTINGKLCKSFRHYKGLFIQLLEEFFDENPSCNVIHGDFSFSNILYCPRSKNIKLIDPRGFFGSEGIYGHPYYDYAKLMHCLHGRYDQIVNDNFQLSQQTTTSYNIHIDDLPLLDKMHLCFINHLKNRNKNIEILYLIESSLFLSMCVLHYENPQRQKALFLNGIFLFNNFFSRIL